MSSGLTIWNFNVESRLGGRFLSRRSQGHVIRSGRASAPVRLVPGVHGRGAPDQDFPLASRRPTTCYRLQISPRPVLRRTSARRVWVIVRQPCEPLQRSSAFTWPSPPLWPCDLLVHRLFQEWERCRINNAGGRRGLFRRIRRQSAYNWISYKSQDELVESSLEIGAEIAITRI